MRFEQSVFILKPLPQVFAFVTCYDNDLVWLEPVLESAQISTGELEVGTRLRRITKWLGRKFITNAEIVEFVPYLKSCSRTTSGAIRQLESRYFEATANGTKLTVVLEGDFSNIFSLVDEVIERIMRRQLGTDLYTLKDFLEASN